VTVEGASAEFNADVKDRFTIVRQGDKWLLDPKPAFTVDSDRIANWLVQIEQLTPSEIATDTPTDETRRTDLLLKPSAQITLHYKKADGGTGDWKLTIGQDKAGDVYLFSSSRPTVYKTASGAIDRLRVPKEYFRDGKRAFHFDVELAREIEVYSGGKPYKFRKDGATWKTVSGEGELQVDRLVSLIQKISQLEAQEFLPIDRAKGFTPAHQVVVRDDKGHVLLDLSWGDTYKSERPYNKGMTFRFVKTNLEKDAMGVSSVSLDALTSAPLVRTKSSK
jgi:hypothetical protein